MIKDKIYTQPNYRNDTNALRTPLNAHRIFVEKYSIRGKKINIKSPTEPKEIQTMKEGQHNTVVIIFCSANIHIS